MDNYYNRKNHKEDIKLRLYNFGVSSFNIVISDDDFSISVRDSVVLNSLCRQHRKLPFSFYRVSGDFIIPNYSLTSLEGLPKSVGGYLDLGYNTFDSLMGLSTTVGKSIKLSNCLFPYTEENFVILQNLNTPNLELSESTRQAYNRFITIKKIIE